MNFRRRAVTLATALLSTVALPAGTGLSRASAADEPTTAVHVFQPAQLAARAGENASLLRQVTPADVDRVAHGVTTSSDNRFIAATSTAMLVVDFVKQNADGVSAVTASVLPNGSAPIQLAQTKVLQVGNAYTATTTVGGKTAVTHPEVAATSCIPCGAYGVGGGAITAGLGIVCATAAALPVIDIIGCGVAALAGVVAGAGATAICLMGCQGPAPKATMIIDGAICRDTECTVYYTIFDDLSRCGDLSLEGYWSGTTPTAQQNWTSHNTDYSRVCGGNTTPNMVTVMGGDHAQCDTSVTLFLGFAYDSISYTESSRRNVVNINSGLLAPC